ncbi:nitrogen fixation protein NifM [Ferribacterium limneticum]|uniref:nitrogen fixation protein NifM n=1 Tax=Ferribacterium limneticum TaxID=76259 RepID=UPI001CF919C6|nr:nitrogen fixation protein NifM [Ferribacterium limneticum]UCV24324.1 nitrogen fixation protein NifM [Ferribacterium limneticum]
MQHGYLELKLAHELFKKAPDTLSEAEQARLDEVAGKQARLEQRILASITAAQVVVPAPTIATRLDEIRQRYASPDDMAADLERNGLNADKLAEAVERDLRIEAVLDKVASAVPAVTEVDAEIYYRLHPEAFDRPEARRLRHILITFSNPIEKAIAAKTLEDLRSTGKNVENFSQAALRHSQCPTAMDGGKLGTVKRQQLFPELEPAAFELAVDEVSEVLESPMGLHILRCDEILPFGMMAFTEASPRIIEKLTEKRRREAQRDWIKEQA